MQDDEEPRDEGSIDRIQIRKDDSSFEVYFFRGWTTYDHPITPKDPLFFEQAMQRRAFCRAWMLVRGDERRFVRFDCVENRRTPIDGTRSQADDTRVEFFEVNQVNGKLVIGSKLSLADVLDRSEYAVHDPSVEPGITHIQARVQYYFEYEYNDDGLLVRVVTRNADGKTHTFER